MPTIHETFVEQVQLAQTYALDGAFRSAARVLRELAVGLVDHAEACDANMPHDPKRSRDVAVEVHMAVLGHVTLEQARSYVDNAMTAAIDHGALELHDGLPVYQFNGEVALAPRWES